MDNLLQLKNIKKVYGTKIKTEVLHGLNISFKKGEFVSIIGQSGSGKSTLLNIIGTLDKPTEGEILFKEKRLNHMNGKELSTFRNDNVGFIFQFHYLLPEVNVLENVLMPAWISKGRTPSKDVIKRAKRLIEIVGVKDRMYNKPNELSGGQRQRIAIARALINNPALVLADEPTGNLDSDSTDKVYELLRDINKEFKSTFIIVTHDMHIAAKADRVIEIKDGNVIRDVNNIGKNEIESFKDFTPTSCFLCEK
ncbi:ABC transporter ATP-binding protein [Thermohalobacter berrensis]|uniref:Lipoprotein ABC transporter ATP-binding protein n=1 Tax=Thermohalobacter berrensis TaxID=99594 RepID=A0A419T7D0_9FIRM|nr:ABC transporter ATP-binding protein [Thermohalobacter berrensis]RKD33497.1 lipoprotein ABC transporter ATP-binding protein [Thermohalobacter berrensis]